LYGVRTQDVEAETGVEVGKLVLSPTRTYAPIVKALLETMRDDIHGMVHCSGGAQTKVLHFVKDVHVIKDQLFPCPPLFKMIQQQSNTDWKVRASCPTAVCGVRVC
jgi:phosphoribosylformylglycinamidine cyclo-ligase